MFSGITSGLYGSVGSAVAAALAGAALCWALTARAGGRRWAWAGLGAALGAEVSVTLLTPGGGALTRRCVVDHDLPAPFHTTQGLLNLVLFLPVGLFAALALRALAPVLALVVLLPLATELAQSLVPAVGRLCDSGDVEMNALGGLAGAAAGRLLLRLTGRPLPAAGAGARRTAQVSVAFLAVAGALWAGLITQIPVDATSLQLAGGKERAAAGRAIRDAFGDRYRIANVQVQPGVNGAPTQLFIALDTGFAMLSWPDATQLTASLEQSAAVTGASFPVTGVTAAPRGPQAALPIATRYAREHFPWALHDGAQARTYPVGDHAELGWVVSWRRRNTAGVLMPMRLDVQIDRGGRVSQLLARRVGDPASLPPVKVGSAKAGATALATVGSSLPEGTGARITDTELLAVRRGARWRVQWLFAVQPAASPATSLYVDATTGRPVPTATEQQSVLDPDSLTGPDQATLSDGPPPSRP
ncbi:VanZ family protein [Actinacidiphila sp. ITFR-21]|uniref:VanZ family protein n=1 Tax=Actinacidiphila sp. ITFR-21 TaxID=3075199 RepID=UPI002889CA47|nr:VanZ family protein [Streptomyces sp. ITFR-21]WNI16033.1 VanZ family protein [Streptomyces sp. ITFR-21]